MRVEDYKFKAIIGYITNLRPALTAKHLVKIKKTHL